MKKINKENVRPRLVRTGFNLFVSVFRMVLFVVLAFVVLYPVFSKISTSFMTIEDVYDVSVKYFPRNPTLENYRNVWESLNIPMLMLKTILFVGIVALLQTLTAAVVGYGLARFKFRMNGPLSILAITSMLIPPDLIMIGLFSQFRQFDFLNIITSLRGGEVISLINTPWPMIILAITGTGYRCGLYILLMRQFFRGLPTEFEESAYIDGAGPIRSFVKIIFPNSLTMVITVFLFSFVWTWLDTKYIGNLLPELDVLQNQVLSLNSLFLTEGADLVTRSLVTTTGAVFLMVPLLLLYLVTQKYFVQSVATSGLVG